MFHCVIWHTVMDVSKRTDHIINTVGFSEIRY